MNRLIKIFILIVLSLSVFLIYRITNTSTFNLLCIGDNLSLGINSYGIKDYSYIEYYKDYLLKHNKKVNINKNYQKEDLSISNMLDIIKTNPTIKRDLTESHLLIINLGYNDLIYQLSLTEEINNYKLNRIINKINNNYQELIKEIRKYYKNEIYVIGYYKSNKNDYYINLGIRKLNVLLNSAEEVNYIDTYSLLNNRNKYFSNPESYYPNTEAYHMISNKIIRKTLEKQ